MSTSEPTGGRATVVPAGGRRRPLSYERKLQLMGIALAALAAIYAKSAIGYGVGVSNGTVEAGVLPFALGALLLVLSVPLVLTRGGDQSAPAETAERRRELSQSAKFFVALVGYVALVTLIGFPIGTLVAVPATLRLVFKYSYRRAVLYGVGMSALFYVLFTHVLGVQLP